MTGEHRWGRTWQALAQPSALTMLFLGFGSGLPFLLVSATLAFWLAESGYRIDQITLLSGAGLSYALKFLWAPLIDRWRLPALGRLGLRRGWLVTTQVGVAAGLLGMVAIGPDLLWPFVAITLFTAFAGASQDIVVDAYRVEIAPLKAQGALAATYSLGYRLALIVSYALALVLSEHLSWQAVYVLMAALMVIPLAATLLAGEPVTQERMAHGWRESMWDGVVMPFADFFRRYRGWLGIGLLLFILLFKISDQSLAGGLIGPFYLAAGFDKTQIATISKLYGVWIGIGGAFLGGLAVARYGIRASLWVAIILGAVSNLLYVVLANAHGQWWIFALVITGENVSSGFLGTVTVAYLSALVNKRYTATQYALFSSLVNLPGKLVGIFSGSMVIWFSQAPRATMTGYQYYFVFTTVAILPALILYFWLSRRVTVGDERS